MKLYATPVPSTYLIKAHGHIPDTRQQWLDLDYTGTFDDYLEKPVCLIYDNRSYVKVGHNSDTRTVHYRTDGKCAVSL